MCRLAEKDRKCPASALLIERALSKNFRVRTVAVDATAIPTANLKVKVTSLFLRRLAYSVCGLPWSSLDSK